MIHAGPKPLKVAFDIARKLQSELSGLLSPEQRRDLTRVLKLIEEADRNHVIEVTRLMAASKSPYVPPTTTGSAAAAAAPSRKRFLWM